jgi:hypothetical protein
MGVIAAQIIFDNVNLTMIKYREIETTSLFVRLQR